MQLIRKLLSLKRPAIGRNGKIRGLSTAELVGIIVIVGILGALGGTYIAGLVGQAQTNAIAQNIASLNTVAASALAGGATFGAGGVANGQIDTTSSKSILTALNTPGVTINGVSYQMSPAISAKAITAGTYVATATGTPPNATIVFTQGVDSSSNPINVP